MKKFVIRTLGCKVNQYDSLNLKKKLIETGFEYSRDSGEDVEFAIVNSCAVTKTSIRKGRRTLSLIRRDNPNAKIVLFGCWVKTYPEEMENIIADIIWPVGKLDELVQEIKKCFGNISGFKKELVKINPPGEGEKSRYFIKIQDGCEQFCSYCIIPYSRGKLFSRPQEEVLKEIESASIAGYDEIVLCGIHLGLYGKEKNSRTCNLNQLLQNALKIKKLGRIRLSSIEVVDVDDDLLNLIAKKKKLCKHLHFSLQAGNDKILKAMNRPYTTQYFRDRVEKARQLMPDIALTTDVIVGFPGETKEDFMTTLNFCKEIAFSRMHVFPFSAHEKTPAASMFCQLSREEKQKRSKMLRKVSDLMKKTYEDRFKGQCLDVVIEKVQKEVWGKTEFYFDIKQKKTLLEKSETLEIGKLNRLRN